MQLSFSIADFLMLALALQGFILAGLLFFSSKTLISNRWLGILIFIVSESTLIMELDYSGIWQKYPILQLIIIHFTLAIGPVIYFYTQSLIFTRDKLSLKTWLNFLPLLLELKYQIIFLLYITGLLSVPFIQNIYFLPSTQQLLFGDFPLTTFIAFISVTVYSVITYRSILLYGKSADLSAHKLRDLKWVKNLLHFIFIFIGIWLFSLIDNIGVLKGIFGFWDHYILYVPAIVFVYFLGMAAYRRQNNMAADEKAEYSQKPVKLYFTTNEADSYAQRLTELMANKQAYLNPVLKVDDVAAMLAISDKALSSFLNQYMGSSFNDLVNGYRVEEAKKRLTDPTYHNFTIAAIAYDCGFNSLATFQRVFKQFTGITPSKYQNNIFLPRLSIK